MSDSVKEFFEKYKVESTKVKEKSPDVVNGFSGLFSKVMKDGALSLREKELIAVAIGVAVKCEPCIRLHTRKCLECGATEEQILEAASVAVVMGGGPAFTHIPIIIETIEGLKS